MLINISFSVEELAELIRDNLFPGKKYQKGMPLFQPEVSFCSQGDVFQYALIDSSYVALSDCILYIKSSILDFSLDEENYEIDITFLVTNETLEKVEVSCTKK